MSNSKEYYVITHRATVTGGFGRSRVRLRDGGRWWVTSSGLRFRKSDGECKTDPSKLLLDTIEKIPKPTGVYEEIDRVGYRVFTRRGKRKKK